MKFLITFLVFSNYLLGCNTSDPSDLQKLLQAEQFSSIWSGKLQAYGLPTCPEPDCEVLPIDGYLSFVDKEYWVECKINIMCGDTLLKRIEITERGTYDYEAEYQNEYSDSPAWIGTMRFTPKTENDSWKASFVYLPDEASISTTIHHPLTEGCSITLLWLHAPNRLPS